VLKKKKKKKKKRKKRERKWGARQTDRQEWSKERERGAPTQIIIRKQKETQKKAKQTIKRSRTRLVLLLHHLKQTVFINTVDKGNFKQGTMRERRRRNERKERINDENKEE
jgi:hypothetical protein